MKQIPLALLAFAFILIGSGCAHNQRTVATAPPPSAQPAHPQTDVYTESVALPPADFAAISKADSAYVTALDAHDLDGAKQKLDQPGTFKGIVTAVYEPSDGKLRILNFDVEYRNALAAVVWSEDAGKFPNLNQLVGKEVLVSGTFIDYHDRIEIVLKSPDQLKLVQ